MLQSQMVVKQYGVLKSTLEYITESNFTIPADFRDLYKSYHLLVWNSSYFLDKTTNMHGYLYHDSKLWKIVWRTPRGILKVNPSSDVLLSFREPIPEYGILPTVVVKMGNHK